METNGDMKLTESKLRQLIRQVIAEDRRSDIASARAKKGLTAKSTKTGKTVYFKDKEAMKAALKKGTHKSIDKTQDKEPKAEPKTAKVAANPFGDKDSETGKDYTRKFMGTDEPKKGTKRDVDSDIYAQDTWKSGGQDMFGVTDWESNADDIIDRLQGDEYDDEYRDEFFQSTVEAGQDTKVINRLLKNPDAIKGEDEALAYNTVKSAIENEELPEQPDDIDLQNFWGSIEDDLLDQILGESNKSIKSQLQKEFKQYGFTKKANNWKRAL